MSIIILVKSNLTSSAWEWHPSQQELPNAEPGNHVHEEPADSEEAGMAKYDT